ncbi:MAG: hypothetical protein GEV07_30430 [Streptosporangiales bacterium]|nr:hypothetical protein [Streptosporangiales bacterium]
MTVYVEHTSPRTDLLWTRLWADSAKELQQLAAKLEVACTPRRRAILIGAIPVRIRPRDPEPHVPAEVAGMTEPPIIGDAGAARNLDRDGHRLLAAIHRLTPRQACDALAFLAGYHQDATEQALTYATSSSQQATEQVAVVELTELEEAA